jgi:hypothetical protein
VFRREEMNLNIPETPRSGRRLRLLVAALVSVGLLVPLAALGAGNSGQTASAAQYKITICHHTHSKKHPMVTIRISNKAWPAHQRHGDTMGACTTAKAKHAKHAKHAMQVKHAKHAKQVKQVKHATQVKHAKQVEQAQQAEHANNGKSQDKGNNGASGTNPSQAQSPSHANEHANEHAKHGK